MFTDKILSNCHCGFTGEGYNATIVDYDIYLNDLDDVILKGKCAECGGPIGRYLETEEVEKYQKRIQFVIKQN